MQTRLQVVLSHSGVTSRRKAAEIIEKGLVTVNGNIVKERGFRVDLDKDRIEVRGRPVRAERKMYFVLNKPKGVVTTLSDEKNRRTVIDLIKGVRARLYPIGRLDKDTEGVILLTNDGDLAHRLMHPSYGVKKVYTAVVRGEITPEKVLKLEKGVYIGGERTAPCRVEVVKKGRDMNVLRIELYEGMKRQIRKMLYAVGGDVQRLMRINYGGITAKGLVPGSFRPLTDDEVRALKTGCGL